MTKHILFTCWLAILLLAGCSTTRLKTPEPKAPSHGQIILFKTIERELSRFMDNEDKLITMDSDYGCLPEPDMRKLIALALFDFDNTYIVEARDCDDLAIEFIVKLRKSSRNFTGDVPLAPPVGLVGVKLVSDIPEMRYFLDGGVGYHAIVIVRCAGGKWLLVDPNTKKVSEFTGHLYEGTMELLLVIF